MRPGKPMSFATIPRPEGGSPLLVFARCKATSNLVHGECDARSLMRSLSIPNGPSTIALCSRGQVARRWRPRPGFVEAGAIVSALVISDLRHANLFAANIDSPRTPAGKGDAIIRSGAAPNTVSVFDASSEALIDLKRAVGLEEDVRRRCREGGHISECSSTVYMYSNGESHVDPSLTRGGLKS